jgi:hypothetical protein
VRAVEIPVHYGRRLGESTVTRRLSKAVRLGFLMIGTIICDRFRRLPRLQTTVSPQTLVDIGEHGPS